MVKIASQTFSAGTDVTFDNVFSNDYVQYKVVLSCLGSTTTQALNFRGRTGGTNYTSASYQRQQYYTFSTTIAAYRYTGETFWAVGNVNSGFISALDLEIRNPYQTVYTSALTSYSSNSTTSIESGHYAHGITVTNSFDGAYFYVGGGTMTGTITIYGFKVS